MSGSLHGPFEERYTDVELIGSGSFGEVYRAWDTRRRCNVAVKLPRPTALMDATLVKALRKEAKRLQDLPHQNIVDIYDWGDYQNTPYIVMEYVEGETLKSLLEKGRLSLEETIRIVGQVSAALAFAHNLGIVHCDLKPANILISKDAELIRKNAEVKVSDFGLARALDPAATTASSSAPLTGGTARYMAPEQGDGSGADPTAASDQYSLAAITYEMLTGCPAFPQATGFQIQGAKQSGRITKPSQIERSIPARVENVILKALNPSPQGRYRSVDEFYENLKGAGVNSENQAGWSLAAILVAGVLMVAAYLWQPIDMLITRTANAVQVVGGLAFLLAIAAGIAAAFKRVEPRSALPGQVRVTNKWLHGLNAILALVLIALFVMLAANSRTATADPPGPLPIITPVPVPLAALSAVESYQDSERKLLEMPQAISEDELRGAAADAALDHLLTVRDQLLEQGASIRLTVQVIEQAGGFLDNRTAYVYQRQRRTVERQEPEQPANSDSTETDNYYYLHQIDGSWTVIDWRQKP